MTQVETNFLERGDCQGDFTRCSLTADQCPKFGLLLRASRDGKRRVKGCNDPVARGKRNRSKGDSKARSARKRLGIAGVNTRHEELWGGAVRVEIKAGAQIGPAVTAFLKCEAQSELARPIGDNNPFMAIWMPDGMSDGICSFRLSKVEDLAVALYTQLIEPSLE